MRDELGLLFGGFAIRRWCSGFKFHSECSVIAAGCASHIGLCAQRGVGQKRDKHFGCGESPKNDGVSIRPAMIYAALGSRVSVDLSGRVQPGVGFFAWELKEK